MSKAVVHNTTQAAEWEAMETFRMQEAAKRHLQAEVRCYALQFANGTFFVCRDLDALHGRENRWTEHESEATLYSKADANEMRLAAARTGGLSLALYRVAGPQVA